MNISKGKGSDVSTDTQLLERNDVTAWGAIVLLYLAGCTTALHIGKIPSAIPLLQEQWQLSLTQSGLLISLYSMLIASCGFALGILIRRVGYVSIAVLGIGIVGVGGCIGAFAESLPQLLFGRVFEGLGWIIAVIVMPSMLSALSKPKDKAFVTAAWASFLPVGASTMLLVAPKLQVIGGWQLSWLVASVMSLIAAIVVYIVTRRYRHKLIELSGQPDNRSFMDLAQWKVWLLSACFLAYSFCYIPLLSFFPLLLVENSDYSLRLVSTITALVLLSNAVGSMTMGFLLRRGYRYLPLLLTGFIGSGIAAFFVFHPSSSPMLRVLAAFAYSGVSGTIPGLLFSTMPTFARKPSSIGLLVGLMMQMSGMGMLFGGVVVPGAVEKFGSWIAASWLYVFIALIGATLTLLSGRVASKSVLKLNR